MSNPENTKKQKPVIGITIGDINSISPEVIIKALNDNRILNLLTPVIYGSTKVLSYYRKMLDLNDFNFGQLQDKSHLNHKKINVVNCWEEVLEIHSGTILPEAGKYAFIAIKEAVKDLKEGVIDALVTGPICKENTHSEEFDFPGHTEYISKELGGEGLMMMVSGMLKVGVATGHIPLKDVPAAITKPLLENKIKTMMKSLKKDFMINKPKIAVLGLNPHAGEGGLLGKEENEIIIPTIEELKHKGNLVFGPFAADGFFGDGTFQKYDGILAMYHDQGLIPFKALSFEDGVNYTAGLSKVRTSPDHGTAFAIAGKAVANESSMREAIYLAADIYVKREELAVEVEA